MRNTTTAGLGAVLLLLPLADSAADRLGIDQGEWYLSPLTGIVIDDDDRNAGTGLGLHVGLGTRLARDWNLELGIGGDRLDGTDRFDQIGVSVDLMHMLTERRGISPYVLVGTGYFKTNFREGTSGSITTPPVPDYDNVIAAFGAGFFKSVNALGGHFRADARYRLDAHDMPDYSDIVLQIGLHFPLTRTGRGPGDSDMDGVIDGLDVCPNTPMQYRVDKYGCEYDHDGDGVVDRLDTCPDTGPSTLVDPDGCRI